MRFLTLREFSKAPKQAMSCLAREGKAVLMNNGKPAAIMITVDADSFERVFFTVMRALDYYPDGQSAPRSQTEVSPPHADPQKRHEAFERLMKYPRKPLPPDFDYKQELLEALDEK